MSYVRKMLLPDERVVCIATLHWIIYLKGLAFTVLGGLMGYYDYDLLEWLFGPHLAEEFARPFALVAMAVVLVGIFLILSAWVRQSATEMAITNKRLISKYGIVSRITYEILISRVTGANFAQTATGRVLGYGTVWVHGAGGEVSCVAMIEQPHVFYKSLMDLLERYR